MSAPPRRRPVSPECRDPYKHKACAGQALDWVDDEIVDCACPCHEETALAADYRRNEGAPMSAERRARLMAHRHTDPEATK